MKNTDENKNAKETEKNSHNIVVEGDIFYCKKCNERQNFKTCCPFVTARETAELKKADAELLKADAELRKASSSVF